METPRLRLSALDTAHVPALQAFMQRNEAHLSPWSPPKAADFNTPAYWQRTITTALADATAGHAHRWVIETKPDGELIGTINLTQIARGPFHSAMLGYSLDAAHQGMGLMTEALRLVIQEAFEVLKLHRLQAAYVTDNQRSARVLNRLGFEVIGTAKQYLYINAAWRDHVITQLINTAFDHAPEMRG
jgi:ribosomal-protein-alanine N-acetyltransferase